jgi:hypothetical protein
MYKWKNQFGGVGVVDSRWLLTRTLGGVAAGILFYYVGQGL